MKLWVQLLCVLVSLLGGPVHAERATIAVATNFVSAAEVLVGTFEQSTGHDILLASGSTGKLYAQIINGAPYDAFLAADQERPALLSEAGLALSPVTYAQGALVWWPGPPLPGAGKIALAKPELAPYGAAALEVLKARADWEDLRGRLVYGENVGQAFALAATRNAEAGLVALSLAMERLQPDAARPDVLSGHAPILQDGVVLNPEAPNPVAVAFLEFLTSQDTQATLSNLGYLPVPHD